MTPAPRLPSHFIAQHVTMQCGQGVTIMDRNQLSPGDRWHCLGCGAVDEKIVAAKVAETKEIEDLTRCD